VSVPLRNTAIRFEWPGGASEVRECWADSWRRKPWRGNEGWAFQYSTVQETRLSKAHAVLEEGKLNSPLGGFWTFSLQLKVLTDGFMSWLSHGHKRLSLSWGEAQLLLKLTCNSCASHSLGRKSEPVWGPRAAQWLSIKLGWVLWLHCLQHCWVSGNLTHRYRKWILLNNIRTIANNIVLDTTPHPKLSRNSLARFPI
jgi:hypothetical protein